jgi:spore maturation protein CgeB
MRLLISVSKRNPNTLGSYISRAFDGSFDWQALEFPDKFSALMESPFFKLLYRLWPMAIVAMMDKNFIKQVSEFRPSVIVILKGMEISKWSLQKLKAEGILLVNYNLDHPFIYENRGSGNRFVRDAIPYYDIHITYSTLIKRQLMQQFGAQKVFVLPFGYQLTDVEYDSLQVMNTDEILRVCFVGNPDRKRAQLIRFLVQNGVPVDVYGSNWNRFLEPSPTLKIQGQVNGFDFWKTIVKYRVQLNILRLQNENSHNMRSFEIPAAGGIMLAPATYEHTQYFSVDKEIFTYKTDSECVEKCKFILSLDADAANAIRKNARCRSVGSEYSYAARSRQLVEILNRALQTT